MHLRYLHISDLHFTAQPGEDEGFDPWQFNQDWVTRSLLQTVEDLAKERGAAFDLIFITGDLAYSGQPDEYQVAEAFCERLLQVTALPAERLFLVPGNHDVDWGQVRPNHLRWYYRFENEDQITGTLGDPEVRPVLLRKFDAYRAFAERAMSRPAMGRPLDADPACCYAETVTLTKGGETFQVNVLGLNSALFAGYDGDDQRRLALGIPQLRRVLDARDPDADLTVALLHHPFACFHPADRVCQNQLKQHADLILCGHLHEPENAFLRDPAGQAVFIGAGASFETRESENSLNVVEIDLQSGQGQVQFWKYLPRFHRWQENTDLYPDPERARFSLDIERFAAQARARRTPLPGGASMDVLGRFVDREPQIAHFRRMLAREIDEQVMLVLEAPKKGKSWLLKRLVRECDEQPTAVPVVFLDFYPGSGGLINYASVAREVRRWLGDVRTPALCALENELDRTGPPFRVYDGAGDVSGSHSSFSAEEWARQRDRVGRALCQDLAEFAKPGEYVVLLLDAFEHAPEALCGWLDRWLFDQLRNLRQVLVVVAGRPQCEAFFSRPTSWARLITSVGFEPFTDEEKRAYLRLRNVDLNPAHESLYLEVAHESLLDMATFVDLVQKARGTR